jgi:hypothetical protein
MFGRHLAEAVELTRDMPPGKHFARIGFVLQRPETAYVFLVLRPDPSRTQEEYQLRRNTILMAYCNVLSVELPEARQIVGIAMVPAGHTPASEALCFVRNENMTDDFRSAMRRLQAERNILVNFRERILVAHEREYPESGP